MILLGANRDLDGLVGATVLLGVGKMVNVDHSPKMMMMN